MGLGYAVLRLAGVPFPLGNATIVILVLFLGGIQLMSIGILGEYIGRIYEEVRARPRFIVDEAIGLDREERNISDDRAMDKTRKANVPA